MKIRKNKSKYNEMGINKNTYNLLFKDEENLPEEQKNSPENSHIITMVQTYTRFRQKDIFSKLLKMYFENKYNVDFSQIRFNEETKEYEYEFEGQVYTFDKFSDYITNEKMKKELESYRRDGKCHSKSVSVLINVPEGSILTGYVKRFNGKFLHSVVEIEKMKGTYIIDYTKNIVMPKEQYIQLTAFEELERISDMEYIEDLQKMDILPIIDYKAILTFWKEILKDLEKNSFLIEDDENTTKIIENIKRKKEEMKKKVSECRERMEKESNAKIEEER